MALRKRVQTAAVLGAAAALVAGLTSLAPAATAQFSDHAGDPSSDPSRSAQVARPQALTPGAKAGESAGRKAGAKSGAKAGRKAGQKVGGSRGAKVGEAAGRKAGSAAGAKAGRAAGTKLSAAAGKQAGTTAGARAGARAGSSAGKRAGKGAQGPSCGAVVFFKPDGSRWKCALGDDFNGSTLDTSLWRVMTSAQFNFGTRKDCFTDKPANIYLADGSLNLVARREKANLTCTRGRGHYKTAYTSGMISTYEKWSQAYGRFEFRAKFPYTEARGLQTSLWLWPRDASGATWPVSGEIDVAEWYSQWPDRVIPFLHYAGLDGGKGTNNQCYVDRVQDWHTYLLEWQPGLLRVSFDGATCMENGSVKAPFNKPYLMAMFGGFGLNKNQPTAATPSVNRTQVAWVRVWN